VGFAANYTGVKIMVDPVLSTGLAGVTSGLASAQQAAQDIASAGISDRPADRPDSNSPGGDSTLDSSTPASVVNLSEAVVQLKSSELQVQASATVVASAEQALGTLLDINT
jgi:hypothetical protein